MEAAREVADQRGARRVEALLVLGDTQLKLGKPGEAGRRTDGDGGGPGRCAGSVPGAGRSRSGRRDPEGAGARQARVRGGRRKAEDEELINWARARVQTLEERERQEAERIRQEQERQEQERQRLEADRTRLEAERVERERRERDQEEREKARSAKPKPKPKPKPKAQRRTS